MDQGDRGQNINQNDRQLMSEWFAQASPPPLSTPPEKLPSKTLKHRVIVVTFVILLICLVAGFVFISLRPKTCFDASNYQGLLDILTTFDSDDVDAKYLQPGEPAYAYDVYFQAGEVTLNVEMSEDATEFLQSISTYYKTHRTTAPIAIQIYTNYASSNYLELAQQRLEYIRTILINAGLDTSAISVLQPTFVQSSSEMPGEDDAMQGELPVFVSITPLSLCKT